MKLWSAAIALIAFSTLVGVSHAQAFSLDNATLNTKDGSPRFSDPDEKIQNQFGSTENAPNAFQDNTSSFDSNLSVTKDNSHPDFFLNMVDPRKQ
jgi:hypothetical protein